VGTISQYSYNVFVMYYYIYIKSDIDVLLY